MSGTFFALLALLFLTVLISVNPSAPGGLRRTSPCRRDEKRELIPNKQIPRLRPLGASSGRLRRIAAACGLAMTAIVSG